jgi:hypothetical protein
MKMTGVMAPHKTPSSGSKRLGTTEDAFNKPNDSERPLKKS